MKRGRRADKWLKNTVSGVRYVFQKEGMFGLWARLLTRLSLLRSQLFWGNKFVERPSLKIEEEPPHDCTNILVIDYRVPIGDTSAGDATAIDTLTELRLLGNRVVLLPRYLRHYNEDAKALVERGVEVVVRGGRFRSARHYIAQCGNEFSLVYISRLEIAREFIPVVRQYAPNARIVFHCPDFEFVRERRTAAISKLEADERRWRRTQAAEFATMHAADHVVVVSDAEGAIAASVVGEDKVSVCAVLQFSVSQNVPGFSERKNVCFLGGFGHPPNVDAVKWFTTEIWPEISAKLPDAEFHIIGSEMPPEIAELGNQQGVRALGYVKELDKAFNAYRMGVAPLRVGAGIKGKIAVMLGAGLPCVATSVAVEAMGLRDGWSVLVRDDSREFAGAVLELYKNCELWTNLSRHGQQSISERYGVDARRKGLVRMLARATGNAYTGSVSGKRSLI